MITYEEEQLKSKATEEELDVTSDLTSSLSDEGIEEDKEDNKVNVHEIYDDIGEVLHNFKNFLILESTAI